MTHTHDKLTDKVATLVTDRKQSQLPYEKPKLVRYGELGSLTLGGGDPNFSEDPTFFRTSP